jgi:hypothetical protein
MSFVFTAGTSLQLPTTCIPRPPFRVRPSRRSLQPCTRRAPARFASNRPEFATLRPNALRATTARELQRGPPVSRKSLGGACLRRAAATSTRSGARRSPASHARFSPFRGAACSGPNRAGESDRELVVRSAALDSRGRFGAATHAAPLARASPVLSPGTVARPRFSSALASARSERAQGFPCQQPGDKVLRPATRPECAGSSSRGSPAQRRPCMAARQRGFPLAEAADSCRCPHDANASRGPRQSVSLLDPTQPDEFRARSTSSTHGQAATRPWASKR